MRIIAIQAAAVAVLVPLVYVTLLRPDHPETLQRIETPHATGPAGGHVGGGGVDQGNGWRRSHRKAKEHGHGGRKRTGSRGSESGGSTPPGVIAASTATGAATFAKSSRTPSDDQYDDAVKALLDRVGPGG